jgi:putative endonuclease
MIRRRKDIGDWGEKQACVFLEKKGFRVLERNYHATVGEIDIVALWGDDYYFIEVKTRLDSELANDLSITPVKKRRLEKTVRHFCYHRQIADKGLILAGLIIFVNKVKKTLRFRLVVLS